MFDLDLRHPRLSFSVPIVRDLRRSSPTVAARATLGLKFVDFDHSRDRLDSPESSDLTLYHTFDASHIGQIVECSLVG